MSERLGRRHALEAKEVDSASPGDLELDRAGRFIQGFASDPKHIRVVAAAESAVAIEYEQKRPAWVFARFEQRMAGGGCGAPQVACQFSDLTGEGVGGGRAIERFLETRRCDQLHRPR